MNLQTFLLLLVSITITSCGKKTVTKTQGDFDQDEVLVIAQKIEYPESMPEHMVSSLKKLRERLIKDENTSIIEADASILHLIREFQDPKNNEELQQKATSLVFAIADDIEKAKKGISIKGSITAARVKLEKLSKINSGLKDPDYDLYKEFYEEEIESLNK